MKVVSVYYPQFYKRMAKPKNTLPQRAAMLRAALGTKEPAAALLPGVLDPAVAWAPPKPETGILLVPEAVAAAEEEVGMEVLPR